MIGPRYAPLDVATVAMNVLFLFYSPTLVKIYLIVQCFDAMGSSSGMQQNKNFDQDSVLNFLNIFGFKSFPAGHDIKTFGVKLVALEFIVFHNFCLHNLHTKITHFATRDSPLYSIVSDAVPCFLFFCNHCIIHVHCIWQSPGTCWCSNPVTVNTFLQSTHNYDGRWSKGKWLSYY